ncbi:FecR family protein [Flavitalea sp. BT771]|uniref:FecR family protein n=1 Tax=Flavitalea sp. BT771 TaxID=3063329 RepID=UPI0026E1F338|nr:FecR family protein [Flavitalea sp. BT771]MDO6429851.1 FecR family protein [Flavitalea sp. BT771]MDV6218021.1 FecR family protein [Flavitalea sp. BT771]
MSEQRLRFLFHRYFDKTASAEERAELMALLGDPRHDEETGALLEEAWQRMENGEIVFSGAQSEAMLRHVLDARPATGEAAVIYNKDARRPVITLRRVMAAAVVLLVAGIGTYFQFFRHAGIRQSAAPVAISNKEEIDVPAPCGNNAVLTLADGSTVVLDSARNGTLTQQGDAQVSKANAGRLEYNVLSRQPAAIVYNTVSTRKGGQYQIVLPDGSKAWLNTMSSLRFPTAFAGTERVVELTGEAYFEVEKQHNMPFRVHVNVPGDKGMDVRVLGTHFNVMAYDNEAEIKTTLLEGAVKVVEGDKSSILAPGQQVKLDKHGGFKLDENADVDLAMAWKNGFTSFKSADIKSVLRQVERWYDIDVMYEGDIPERKFSGGISRDANLSDVIRLLEVSKIHFKIKGRKLTVTP